MPIEKLPHHITIFHPPSGAKASIAYIGATVFSWNVGSSDNGEKLWKSSKSSIEGPDDIVGGIPIVWPVFGNPPPNDERLSKVPHHGFASRQRWTFEGLETDDDDEIVAKFYLQSNTATRSIFPFEFHLSYRITLSPRLKSLTTTLKVHYASVSPSSSPRLNSSPPLGSSSPPRRQRSTSASVSMSTANKVTTDPSVKLRFQALLHNYLLLPSGVRPWDVRVEGIEGCEFWDKADEGRWKRVEGKGTGTVAREESDGRETDRVHFDVPGELKVEYKPGCSGLTSASGGNEVEGDGGFNGFGPGPGSSGGISIRKTDNLGEVTFWNPGRGKGSLGEGYMKGLDGRGWEKFVCVEPGSLGGRAGFPWGEGEADAERTDGWVELGWGEVWEGGQTLVGF